MKANIARGRKKSKSGQFRPFKSSAKFHEKNDPQRIEELTRLVMEKPVFWQPYNLLPYVFADERKIVALAAEFAYYSAISKDYRAIHPQAPKRKDVEACIRFLKNFEEKKNARLEKSGYESAIAVRAFLGEIRVGEIKINFGVEDGKRILYIDAVQGRKTRFAVGKVNGKYIWTEKSERSEENQGLNKVFEVQFGIKWPNMLVREAIETAEKAGFSEVHLLRPEFSPYYSLPKADSQKEILERQKQMRSLYYSTAGTEGFKKNKEGKYFILKLK